MAVTTKFDPERIASVASKMYTHQSKLSGALVEIVRQTQTLKSYWQSDAADSYAAKAEIYKKDGDELCETYRSLAERLQKISGIQRSAEKDTTVKAESLPIDGVN